jgi:DNA-binding LytR/AlgR family response regulator
MSDFVQSGSGNPKEKGRLPFFSFPPAESTDRASFNGDVNRRTSESVAADDNEIVVMPQKRLTHREGTPHLQTRPARGSSRIAIKSRGKILLLDSNEVIAVVAQGNYVLLQRQGDHHLLREAISSVAEKLEPYGFIRIHRSVLINKTYVEEIRAWPTGEYGLRTKGGKEYTVTRTYKRMLRSLADLWIGIDSFSGAL